MFYLKGFITMQPYASNQAGVVSAVGELSTYAKTFTRELGVYSNAANPAIDLYTFKSASEETHTEVPTSILEFVLDLGTFVYTGAASGTFNNNRGLFLQELATRFPNRTEDLDCGAMVRFNDTTYMPEWVSFKDAEYTAEDSQIRIWFSNQAFVSQYDEYEHIAVLPSDTPDALIDHFAVVKAISDSLDPSTWMERVENAKGGKPATRSRTMTYDWRNPLDPTRTVKLNFGVIVHGELGNSPDLIRASIAQYILDNSSHPREVWAEYVPDLFRTTEHVFVPLYDRISIPNQTLLTGLNSPILAYKDIQPLMEMFYTSVVSYPQAHVLDNTEFTVLNYKSYTVMTCGSNENRDNIYKFSGRFPDYIVMPSLSPDFARMSPDTQELTLMLRQLIAVAETATEFSTIPTDMSRLIRDDLIYIAKAYKNILYVVLTRESYTAVKPTI